MLKGGGVEGASAYSSAGEGGEDIQKSTASVPFATADGGYSDTPSRALLESAAGEGKHSALPAW